MIPHRTNSTIGWTEFFSPANLTTIEGVDDALRRFSSALERSNYMQALDSLLEEDFPYIVALALSSPFCLDLRDEDQDPASSSTKVKTKTQRATTGKFKSDLKNEVTREAFDVLKLNNRTDIYPKKYLDTLRLVEMGESIKIGLVEMYNTDMIATIMNSATDIGNEEVSMQERQQIYSGYYSIHPALKIKPLTSSSAGVPIYEAKMTGDTRLVYHVDVLEQDDIKGVYTHAELDRTKWDAVSRQLGAQGKEYCQMCKFRKWAPKKGSDTCVPKTGVKTKMRRRYRQHRHPLDLPPDDLEQQLLYSMLAGYSAEFPFIVSSEERRWLSTRFPVMFWAAVVPGTSASLITFLTFNSHFDIPIPSKLQELAQSRKERASEPELNLVDVDDLDDWRSDLPKRFSHLEDRHFPLFIASDMLWSMVEADLMVSEAPSLVYSEIIENSVDGKGFLDRETYENISGGTNPNFAQNRIALYNLFNLYSTKKKRSGDFDPRKGLYLIGILAMDAFRSNCLRARRGMIGQKVDRIYVDEVQDHLLIDALLLRSLCHNPNGMLWAGDTAKLYLLAALFLHELTSFLFRIEQHRERNKNMVKLLMTLPNLPKKLTLTTNYRSHAGIVNVARSIVDIITRFWPDSVDKLDPERGTVAGLNPVFFTGWTPARLKLVRLVPLTDSPKIVMRKWHLELSNASWNLQALYEDPGLILYVPFLFTLTIPESKGLEFNDVLIYDFFNDSTLSDSQWRFVLQAVESSSMGSSIHSEPRYAGVCTEASRVLYVGVTRARNRLWIADCSLKGEHMRTLWTTLDYIENRPSNVNDMVEPSSREQWGAKGDELFERRHYVHARQCYEKANMGHAAAVAHAYSLREIARQTSSLANPDNNDRVVLYTTAARAFVSCAHETHNHHNKKAYLLAAAECFEHGHDISKATEMYLSAEKYEGAAMLYLKSGKFEEAMDVILRYRVLSYAFPSMSGRLFDSVKAEIDFVSAHELHEIKLYLLLHHRRYSDAADIQVNLGNAIEGIKLFLADENYKSAKQVVLRELWQGISFREPDVVHIQDLFAQSKKIDQKIYSQIEMDELRMFEAILLPSKRIDLVKFGAAFCRAGRDVPPCFLSMILFRLLFVDGLDIFELDRTLDSFVSYVLASQTLTAAQHSMPSTRAWLIVRYQNIVVSGEQLFRTGKAFLGEKLLAQIWVENQKCLDAHALAPCWLHRAFEMTLCNKHHVDVSHLTVSWYTAWIAINLKQCIIWSTATQFTSTEKLVNVRLFWVESLFRALYSFDYVFGTSWDTQRKYIPEFSRGYDIVMDWISTLVQNAGTNIPAPSRLSFALSTLEFVTRYRPVDVMNKLIPLLKAVVDEAKCRVRTNSGKDQPLSNLLPSDMYRKSHVFAVTSGVEFLSAISQNKYDIDVNVLCNLMDRLCALFLATCYHYEKGSYSDHLLYGKDGQSLQHDEGGVIRNIFIARVSLGLLGVNLEYERLQCSILGLVKELRLKCDPGNSSQVQRFLEVSTWDSMKDAICQSMKDSPFDEMVQICRTVDPLPPPIAGVRVIKFENFRNFYALVDGPPTQHESRSQLTINTPDGSGNVSAPQPHLSIPTHLIASAVASSSQLYLWQVVPVLERIRFLGPLPHLLFCLSLANKLMYSWKLELKNKVGKGDIVGEDVESLRDRQTLISSSLKKVNALLKRLDFGSEMHRRQDLSQLTTCVQEAGKFLHMLCPEFDFGDELRDNLNF
ncbi:hypothetical protein BDZ97DRAFT_1759046 [Flammula alnicola]|nr:hypothetical protein BDZ97DRAFT_1759046 [Flammula alnicola]